MVSVMNVVSMKIVVVILWLVDWLLVWVKGELDEVFMVCFC